MGLVAFETDGLRVEAGGVVKKQRSILLNRQLDFLVHLDRELALVLDGPVHECVHLEKCFLAFRPVRALFGDPAFEKREAAVRFEVEVDFGDGVEDGVFALFVVGERALAGPFALEVEGVGCAGGEAEENRDKG